jgi:heat shock protein HslJ
MKMSCALIGLILLAGCATGHSRSTDASAALAGTRWTITSIDGQPPVAPDRARLVFEGARVSANVGCNGMGAEYRVEGGRLVVGPVVSTMMYCEGLMDQERAVSTLMAAAPEISRQGNALGLVSGGHSLRATAMVSDQ